MSTSTFSAISRKSLIYGLFVLALSCTDHDIPSNLPESACTATDGSPRLYPCEFVIEKIAFIGSGGVELGAATGSSQTIPVSRFLAKSNTYSGSVAGQSGAATFGVKMVVKRVASPSFPVNEGYLIGRTNNSAGKMILHTPSFPGDTYGERTKIGSPVTLDMAIGETRDITFDLVIPYVMESAGPEVVPAALQVYTSFFIDNDVTTLKFDRTVIPYFYVGSVVEAYYEKLRISLTN